MLESPQVGIIGVGEGSTPWLRGFFEGLGIEEAEWMPACHATYKCGITFDRLVDPARLRELLPSLRVDARQPDDDPVRAQRASRAEPRGCACAPGPLSSSLLALARDCLAPKPQRTFHSTSGTATTSMRYCSAQFLQRKALERGVRYRGAPRNARDTGRERRHRVAATGRRRDAGGRLLRRLHRLRLAADRQGAEDPVRQLCRTTCSTMPRSRCPRRYDGRSCRRPSRPRCGMAGRGRSR